MKLLIKWVIILFNLVILYIAYCWWKKEQSYEPLIVIIGQLISFFSLGSEKASIISKNIKNKAKVGVEINTPTDVHTEDIDDSEVNIKSN